MSVAKVYKTAFDDRIDVKTSGEIGPCLSQPFRVGDAGRFTFEPPQLMHTFSQLRDCWLDDSSDSSNSLATGTHTHVLIHDVDFGDPVCQKRSGQVHIL